MPQITLAYTDNIKIDNKTLQNMLQQFHNAIEKIAKAELASCKTIVCRPAECAEDSTGGDIKYYIGNGGAHHAFITLTVAMWQGRTEEQKSELGSALLNIMQAKLSKFTTTIPNLEIQLIVNIEELGKHYHKLVVNSENNTSARCKL